ncbi:uncharacterized protein LOC128558717 [Mercenaria mercenaria]|uniref:uncharacterized protein LOC128558717 n=1 Tax=Mercenaria mercenaria TaxID=6596 RepID=UPI00234EE6D7|nr:uncharacterized protein LOC128558717 [Mercenaria mercenaria]
MLHREVASKTVDQCVSGCLYDLRIIAITYNRAGSLLRLLNSLNDAEYILDKVKLEVWIDRSVDGEVHQPTLQIANNFSFMHGHYSVEVHPKHVGILSQWISTWKPNKKSSEIAVILEDDLTVSPYFYKYLKRVHKKYDNNPKINGYALQGYKRNHTVDNRTFLEGPKGSLVFLYPIVGFWGFSPSRTNWINFVRWCFTAVHNKSIQPYVPDIIATKNFKVLQKHGKGDSMWSIWHMYYAWKHNEFTLYTNFKGMN